MEYDEWNTMNGIVNDLIAKDECGKGRSRLYDFNEVDFAGY